MLEALGWVVSTSITVLYWLWLIGKGIADSKKASTGADGAPAQLVPPDGTSFSRIGWVTFGGFAVVLFLFLFTTPSAAIGESFSRLNGFFLVFFCVPGVVLLAIGASQKHFYAKHKKYAEAIAAPGEYSIDAIAGAHPNAYDRACADLQRLINSGYFPNVYLVLQERKVVRLQPKPEEKQPLPTPDKVVVRCPGCGFPNRVTAGQSAACGYCGAQLAG